MMKSYFPQLKRWCQTLDVSIDEVMNVNPALDYGHVEAAQA